MKIAVIGATGATGQELVAYGLAAGHEVWAFARNPDRIAVPDWVSEANKSNLHLVKGDIKDPESLLPAVREVDVVYEALGTSDNHPTTIKRDGAAAIVSAMKECGKTRLVAITSAGINGEMVKAMPWFIRAIGIPLFFDNVFADLRACEKVIESAGEWLEYTIVQPGILAIAPATREFSLGLDQESEKELSFADLALAMLTIGENNLFTRKSNVGVAAKVDCEPLPLDKEKKSRYFAAAITDRLTRPSSLLSFAFLATAVTSAIIAARRHQ